MWHTAFTIKKESYKNQIWAHIVKQIILYHTLVLSVRPSRVIQMSHTELSTSTERQQMPGEINTQNSV
jgi:hypothetical protein